MSTRIDLLLRELMHEHEYVTSIIVMELVHMVVSHIIVKTMYPVNKEPPNMKYLRPCRAKG